MGNFTQTGRPFSTWSPQPPGQVHTHISEQSKNHRLAKCQFSSNKKWKKKQTSRRLCQLEQFPTQFVHLGMDPVAITLRIRALRKTGSKNFRDSNVGGFMLWAAGGQLTTVCSWLLGQAETNGQTHWGPGTFLFINQEKEGALTRACTYFGKKALSTMWVKGKQRGLRAAENPCLISPAQGHREESFRP